MKVAKIKIGRRSFIKSSSLASGGMVLGFNWLMSCDMTPSLVKALPKEWFKINIKYFDLLEFRLEKNKLLTNINRKKFLSIFKNFTKKF